MSRPAFANRVLETTDSEGTGSLTLAGAMTGYQAFASQIANGRRCWYVVVDDLLNPVEYEVGIGTLTHGAPDLLSRDTIFTSSNADSRVDWTPGTKYVSISVTAQVLDTLIDTVDSDLITTGSGDAYAIATYRPEAGLYEGRFVVARWHEDCEAAPTLDVDGEGPKPLVRFDGAALRAGDLTAGVYYWLKYDLENDRWAVFSPVNYMPASGGAFTGDVEIDGNLSIGTSDQIVPLQVAAAAAFGNRLTETRMKSGVSPSGATRAFTLIDLVAAMRIWRFANDAAVTIELAIGADSNNIANALIRWWDMYLNYNPERLTFRRRTGNVSKDIMTLLPDGKVGIGTITPQAALDVVGSVRASVGPSDAADLTRKDYVDAHDIGIGQAYVDVTASRFVGVPYTNKTSKPIWVNVRLSNISGTLYVNSGSGNVAADFVGGGGGVKSLSAIIPPGHAYWVDAGSRMAWVELR